VGVLDGGGIGLPSLEKESWTGAQNWSD